MRSVVLAVAAALAAAGCRVPSVGDCAVQCTATSGCPDGLTCEDEGYCRVSGAEMSCAALFDGGGGGAIDAGVPGPDAAPCTDPADCPFAFGRPSPVLEIHATVEDHVTPHLSRDGRRLYFAVKIGAGEYRAYVAERADPDEPFGQPTALGGDLATANLRSLTLTDDELEIVIAINDELFVGERGDVDDDFTLADAPLALSDAGANTGGVALTGDGLELWFNATSGKPRIYRATRDARDEAFGPHEEVTLPGDNVGDLSPQLSRDGYSLIFVRRLEGEPDRIMRAFRADLATTTFDTPIDLDDVNDGETNNPFLSADGTELFFSSDRAWSPADRALWRVHVCTDGPCVDEQVLCEGGALSADLRHCYFLSGDTANWNSGVSTCETQGGHLATVHSQEENDLIASVLEGEGVDPAWIGATDEDGNCTIALEPCSFDWITGEPMLFEFWFTDEPNDMDVGGEDCVWLVDVNGGHWNDASCETEQAAVCERELPYPWW